ncbi:MAG: leucine-rich repeat protein, partial [Thermoplasmatales archaeon]|nr:leucine-rich repeat protein [Thermoplasmatales archaeon]
KERTQSHTYAFIHWTADGSTPADLTSVRSDVTVSPAFAGTLRSYVVTFVLDGAEVKSLPVTYGDAVPASEVPEAAAPFGKYFTGWGDVGKAVVGDTVFEGFFLPLGDCAVTYLDASGGTMYVESVAYGGDASYAGVPEKPSTGTEVFTFRGWSEDGENVAPLRNVIADVTVAPLYDRSEREYSVRFVLNGETVGELSVPYGHVLSDAEIPRAEAPAGKYFTGWGNTAAPVVQDAVFTGGFLPYGDRAVTYLDASGGTMYVEYVPYGGDASYAGVPEKPSTGTEAFVFRGWSEDGENVAPLRNVIADATVAPLYDSVRRDYSVRFVLNGETVGELSVPYGHVLSDAEIPLVEAPPGKYFTGWGNTAAPVVQDAVFVGNLFYNPTHTLIYKDESGNVVGQEIVDNGAPAEFSGRPTKVQSHSHTFTFKGWSEDGATMADLSSVNRDYVLTPLYDQEPRSFKVTLLDYDRKTLSEEYVRYGEAFTNYPDDPSRPPSVDKVYSFLGWSVSNGRYVPADLSSITTSRIAYASYGFVGHPYTLTINLDDGSVVTREIRYGEFLSESLMMDSVEGHLLRFYRDGAMTKRVNTSVMFSGDTTLYAEKIPGKYAYANADRTSVAVSFAGAVPDPRVEDGICLACDISSFSDGKTVELETGTVREIESRFGKSVDIRISLYRGDMIIGTDDLIRLCGDSEKTVSFSIGRGPTTSVRINSSLKNVDYDRTYTISLKIDGRTVVDMPDSPMAVLVPYEKDSDPAVEPRVWSANGNTGTLTRVDCECSGGGLLFAPRAYPYFAVGTSAERTEAIDGGDPCPYGEVEYNCTGESSENYASTLRKMTIDNGGRTLHVPSAMEGYPLKHIEAGAFAGVRNAPSIVIPDTVLDFDWASLSGTDVTKIVFLGDRPEFTGEPPASVTVFYASDAGGWGDTECGEPRIVPMAAPEPGDGRGETECGEPRIVPMGAPEPGDGWGETGYERLDIHRYVKDRYVVSYYLLDDEITVREWISGRFVDIPSKISVGGTEYPVTTIGCNAFKDSQAVNVRIPASVDAIQTRAFYGSSMMEQLSWASGGSATVIADEAFRNCSRLRSNTETIPDTVRFIGFEAYRNCGMFRSIVLPGSVTDVREGAFYNCPLLASVTLGEGADAIPDRCFAYCNVLDGVILPDNVTSIGNDAFYKCPSLSHFNTNRVESIGVNAFRLCPTLESVTFGPSLKSIGRNAFAESNMLRDIEAYCEQPEGYANAFNVAGTVPESVKTRVNYDVAGSWTHGHAVMEKEDDLKESLVVRTMPAVLGAITVSLVILGVVSAGARRRMMSP